MKPQIAPQSLSDREQARWQIRRLLAMVLDDGAAEEDRRAAAERAERIMRATDLRLVDLLGPLSSAADDPPAPLPVVDPGSEVPASVPPAKSVRQGAKREVRRARLVERPPGILTFAEAVERGLSGKDERDGDDNLGCGGDAFKAQAGPEPVRKDVPGDRA